MADSSGTAFHDSFVFFLLSIFVTDFSLPTGQKDPFRCSGICYVL